MTIILEGKSIIGQIEIVSICAAAITGIGTIIYYAYKILHKVLSIVMSFCNLIFGRYFRYFRKKLNLNDITYFSELKDPHGLNKRIHDYCLDRQQEIAEKFFSSMNEDE
jgi:hypothetical protein